MSEAEGTGGGGWPRRTDGATVAADVLQRLAAARPDDLLRRLAEIALDVTDADRATVHVVEGAGLRAAVAIGRGGTPAPPLQIGDDRAASLLASPRASVDILASTSLALVPVVRAGAPVALLALDWHDGQVRREHVRLLEAVAAYAGADHRPVGPPARRLALDLAAADSVADVAAAAERWCRDVLGQTVLAVALLDRAGRAVVAGGESAPMPPELEAAFDGVFGGAAVDAPGLLAGVVAADGLGRCFASRLDAGGDLVGGLVIGTAERHDLAAAEREAIAAAGELLAAALARVRAQAERARDDLRAIADQLLAAVSLLARHHAGVLPPGSGDARRAERLAQLAEAGRRGLADPGR